MVSILSGRYELGERIGTGGSAHVYSALDVVLDRLVAVKILDDAAAGSADPAARERFITEARSSARFSHPHAVTTLDAGIDEGQLFLVMELVAGRSLAQHLAANGPLSEEEVIRIGVEILGALDAAHRAGLVHRDVKPANVLLDGTGSAKLADFGIAKQFDEIGDSLTQTGMVVGTRHYLSPEQAAGRSVGPASDIYSLGVVLYESLTGARPTPGIERAPHDRLDVRSLLPTIGVAMATVIATATAVSPSDRYRDANDMAGALAAAPHLSATATTETTEIPTARLPIFGPEQGLPPPPRPPTLQPVGGETTRPSPSRAWWILLPVILAAGIGVAVARSTGDGSPDVNADAPQPGATSLVTAPTIPTTTAPPTTAPPTTAPPTTAPPPVVVDELIPGFPRPDDVEGFLETLNNNPDLVGERGQELAKQLEQLLDEPADGRAKRLDRLRRDIEEWTNDGQIDPTIAAVASDYLDRVEVTEESNRDD